MLALSGWLLACWPTRSLVGCRFRAVSSPSLHRQTLTRQRSRLPRRWLLARRHVLISLFIPLWFHGIYFRVWFVVVVVLLLFNTSTQVPFNRAQVFSFVFFFWSLSVFIIGFSVAKIPTASIQFLNMRCNNNYFYYKQLFQMCVLYLSLSRMFVSRGSFCFPFNLYFYCLYMIQRVSLVISIPAKIARAGFAWFYVIRFAALPTLIILTTGLVRAHQAIRSTEHHLKTPKSYLK